MQLCRGNRSNWQLRWVRLALPDTFALTLAKKRGWLLLTGDGPLRALAAAEQVECHGVLWLIDLMHTERVVDENDRKSNRID